MKSSNLFFDLIALIVREFIVRYQYYTINNSLCISFLSKIYRFVLIPNYKRTYNQSYQIKKLIQALH